MTLKENASVATNISILLQTACTPAVVKHLAIQEPASTKPAAERASERSGRDLGYGRHAREPEERGRGTGEGAGGEGEGDTGSGVG